MQGIESFSRADSDNGNLQLITQVLDGVQEIVLLHQAAGQYVVDLVDNQHTETNAAQDRDDLKLFSAR